MYNVGRFDIWMNVTLESLVVGQNLRLLLCCSCPSRIQNWDTPTLQDDNCSGQM